MILRIDPRLLAISASLLAGAITVPASVAQQPSLERAQALGSFFAQRRGIVERSTIVLERPNEKPVEAMPLGNGRLGAAVWAQDGLTVQLNRADTLPARLSPGQIHVPGLARLTRSADYRGSLNLYDGEFTEQGGAMQASVYMDESLDVLVIDVRGADPAQIQTATLELWEPRQPHATAADGIATLTESWLDDKEAGAGNERFGSLAAISADALDLHAEVHDPLTVELSFRPHPDGSFRIFAASPAWRGGNATAISAGLLAAARKLSAEEHRGWWHGFWSRTALVALSSPDQTAEYFENLRAIYLFTAAAESRGPLPGSQAGIGDLFSAFGDAHKWGPSGYWHWNLRMQVGANLGAGLAEFNQPYFRLYRQNLPNILAWTRQHMGGRAGICVPETMRFNGRGYENESWLPNAPINCGLDFPPYYNARTISTGAEISLWILDQYEYTGDLAFLRANFPLIRESIRFLLAYGKRDSGGVLHTDPSNSHEMQWDVRDPITDISAMRTLFPRFVQAARLLDTDAELARQVEAQAHKLPELPLVSLAAPKEVLAPGASLSDAILATSYSPQAETHNSENNGLEPVWPYGLIGDDGPMHAIGVLTFMNRPYKNIDDWSYDPVQAARLGLADEFRSSLAAITEHYQAFPSGLAEFEDTEFYVEQLGNVALGLQTALADDYNGVVRIAEAWPAGWDADATVFLRHRNKANLRIRSGRVVQLEIEAGSSGTVSIRNPWPGDSVRILRASAPGKVLYTAAGSIFKVETSAGAVYEIERATAPAGANNVEPIAALPASTPKKLGSRTIGLAR
jgi:hypothetical protein